MPKKNSSPGGAVSADQSTTTSLLLHTSEKDVDPVLASLFQSSAGPIALSKKKSFVSEPRTTKDQAEDEASVASDNSVSSEENDSELEFSTQSLQPESRHSTEEQALKATLSRKKRKRTDAEDDLEDRYMQRLAEDEAKEGERSKRSKTSKDTENGIKALADEDSSASSNSSDAEESELGQSDEEATKLENDIDLPQHESLSKSADNPEIEKASRTVFLGNVSTQAITSKSAKKELLSHLASFFPSLPKADAPYKVESIRFRSTAYALKLPKKTSFVRKELLDTTTKSTNAYAVYSSKVAAREAVKHLNGTVVLERHLRVDHVAHPCKVDHRRCVFVGNLAFVDDENKQNDESNGEDGTPKKKKTRPPADVEEGLWRQFAKAGPVESVRVIRDQQTRIGKGIAYVQFTDENAVEAALLFNDKKFPPLLPRPLRVTRAKSFKRNAAKGPATSKATSSTNGTADRTMQGRAGRLLGRAGAAQMRNPKKWAPKREKRESRDVEEGGGLVFEGHRAQSNEGNKGLRFGGGKKQKGRPNNRSAKRAVAWKKANKK